MRHAGDPKQKPDEVEHADHICWQDGICYFHVGGDCSHKVPALERIQHMYYLNNQNHSYMAMHWPRMHCDAAAEVIR